MEMENVGAVLMVSTQYGDVPVDDVFVSHSTRPLCTRSTTKAGGPQHGWLIARRSWKRELNLHLPTPDRFKSMPVTTDIIQRHGLTVIRTRPPAIVCHPDACGRIAFTSSGLNDSHAISGPTTS